ncbi:MAG: carboxypeptidase regulatory-like domain-containing protein [Planctomycetes bacterium]|nr:carboxypeptidase regulatory-like domain-containing protein [Planctomycetota bacterium]
MTATHHPHLIHSMRPGQKALVVLILLLLASGSGTAYWLLTRTTGRDGKKAAATPVDRSPATPAPGPNGPAGGGADSGARPGEGTNVPKSPGEAAERVAPAERSILNPENFVAWSKPPVENALPPAMTTIKGQVVGPDGRSPYAGATVSISTDGGGSVSGPSDDSGAFRFTIPTFSLPARRLEITVRSRARDPGGWEHAAVGLAVPEPRRYQVIALGAVAFAAGGWGTTLTVDVGMPLPAGGGFAVVADELDLSAGDVSGRVALGADGKATIRDLAPGNHAVWVSVAGYLPAKREFQVTESRPGATALFALAPAVEGTIAVTGPAGRPVERYRALIGSLSPATCYRLEVFSADGRARCPVAPSMRAIWWVSAPGFAPGFGVSVLPASGEMAVRLSRGGDVKGRVETAVPGAASGDERWRLDIYRTDLPPEAHGHQRALMGMAFEQLSPPFAPRAKTPANALDLGPLEPGKYALMVYRSDATLDRPVEFEVVEGKTTDLGALRPGPGATIRGRVTGARAKTIGALSARVLVAPFCPPPAEYAADVVRAEAPVNAAGEWESGSLPAGEARLEIAGPHGERLRALPLTLAAGERREITVNLDE